MKKSFISVLVPLGERITLRFVWMVRGVPWSDLRGLAQGPTAGLDREISERPDIAESDRDLFSTNAEAIISISV
jgi:hypothetical protein